MHILLLAVLLPVAISASISPSKYSFEFFKKDVINDAVLGTDFVLAYLNSHIDINDNTYTENLTLIINNPDATEDALVTISSPFPQFENTTIHVAAGTTNRYKGIPPSIQAQYGDTTRGNFTVEPKGIAITSTLPITVIASNEHTDGGSGDQFFVIPTCELNTDYNTVSDESDSGTTRILSVIVLTDNTEVVIHNGTRYAVSFPNMNRLQVITYTTNEARLTNAEVHASKNVAVVSGTVCGYGWVVSGTCNHQAIMLLPTTAYGTNFPAVPFAGSVASEYTITPLMDSTTVSINGKPALTINADQWLRANLENVYLTSDKPIQVVQVGGALTSNYGNPFFVHVPAVPEHMVTTQSLQFATGFDNFNQATITHYVRIVTSVEYIGRIAVDNYFPNQLAYTRAGNSKYYFYEQIIPHGTHTVSTPVKNATFSVIAFGYDIKLGYGFVAGLNLPCSPPARRVIDAMKKPADDPK